MKEIAFRPGYQGSFPTGPIGYKDLESGRSHDLIQCRAGMTSRCLLITRWSGFRQGCFVTYTTMTNASDHAFRDGFSNRPSTVLRRGCSQQLESSKTDTSTRVPGKFEVGEKNWHCLILKTHRCVVRRQAHTSRTRITPKPDHAGFFGQEMLTQRT